MMRCCLIIVYCMLTDLATVTSVWTGSISRTFIFVKQRPQMFIQPKQDTANLSHITVRHKTGLLIRLTFAATKYWTDANLTTEQPADRKETGDWSLWHVLHSGCVIIRLLLWGKERAAGRGSFIRLSLLRLAACCHRTNMCIFTAL